MNLKVLYITVQFPVPSETFAAVEIRALRRQQASVSVATLKPARRESDTMLQEHGLTDIEIDHNSLVSSLRGCWIGLRNPPLTIRLLKAVFATQDSAPPSSSAKTGIDETGTVERESSKRSILKGLALIPRSLDLFDKIRRTSPDIVHLFWGHYPSLVGLLVHEFLEDVTVSLSLGAYDLHSRYGPSIELAKKAPAVFTHVQANRPVLRSFGVEDNRIHVVYRGIDIQEQTHGTEDGKPLDVLIVERLVPAKRTSDSLKVFREVRDSIPTARLTIAGDGAERESLMKQAAELGLKDAISFLGHVSHGKVFELCSKSKVLLSMSASERLPNAVKEAMLRDCIPVVAHTVGIEELISEGKTGFIVEQGNRAQAATAVLNCLRDWDGSAALRTAAQRHINETFDSNAVAHRRRKIWQKLLEQSGRLPADQ